VKDSDVLTIPGHHLADLFLTGDIVNGTGHAKLVGVGTRIRELGRRFPGLIDRNAAIIKPRAR
jgi:hypothetical protein